MLGFINFDNSQNSRAWHAFFETCEKGLVQSIGTFLRYFRFLISSDDGEQFGQSSCIIVGNSIL